MVVKVIFISTRVVHIICSSLLFVCIFKVSKLSLFTFLVVHLQAEVLQSIHDEYTYDEFLDFSLSTVELNCKVSNLLTETGRLSEKVKVSRRVSMQCTRTQLETFIVGKK